ncbi:MAG: MotA/TolQ/ExbB proton channel family protein [Eubacterium sp.]|nr:MotA/TolQ/ExbB proton channel family protein [Eubacterium sp.]
MSTNVSGMLRSVASNMQYPVMIILLILLAVAIVLAGTLVVEIFTERRHLKVKMPELVDQLKKGDVSTEECIANSGLLKKQKKMLIELTKHEEITNDMREALAVRLLEEEQAGYDRRVQISDLVAKLGPMLGLLGTLIPLGPGIVALGQGNTFALSQSLLAAFDTTIVGLLGAAVAMVISMIRKQWYRNYMSVLEALTECVLEVEKTHVEKE